MLYRLGILDDDYCYGILGRQILMATIYTDSLAFNDIDIVLGDARIGRKGRELCFSSDNDEIEVRIVLSDEQLSALKSCLWEFE